MQCLCTVCADVDGWNGRLGKLRNWRRERSISRRVPRIFVAPTPRGLALFEWRRRGEEDKMRL